MDNIRSVEDDLEYLRRHPNELKPPYKGPDFLRDVLKIFVILTALLFLGWAVAVSV